MKITQGLSLILCLMIGSSVLAEDIYTTIPLKNDDLPASDLVSNASGSMQVLPPDNWANLKANGTDLSKVEPDPTQSLWNGTMNTGDEVLDNALPVQSGDTLSFSAVVPLQAPDGDIYFNAFSYSGDGSPKILTLVMTKTLHTVLLKKELLRKLGYKVAAMKYLSQVKLHFASSKDANDFLTISVPYWTDGSADRWAPNVDPKSSDIVLQDIAVMDTTPHITRLPFGPPIDNPNHSKDYSQTTAQSARVLRALPLAYGIADAPQSIDGFDWRLGQIVNQALSIPITSNPANYNCKLDDALWLARRIAQLSREDFYDIARRAAFPEPLAQLVAEKMISRRNTLLALFPNRASSDHANVFLEPELQKALPVNHRVNYEKSIVDGKVIQQNWPGYASQFAYGDPPSPLKNLGYYLLAEGHSNLESYLVTKLNEQLPSLTIAKDISSHNNDLYQKVIANYIKTGIVQSIPFGVWAAPLANGGVNLSRSVVIGNYLGTNNLVQLADTFGFYVNVGVYLGFNSPPPDMSLQSTVQGTFAINWTHIKPLTNLKQGVTEPLKNEFALWIFHNASGVFNQASGDKDKTVVDAGKIKDKMTQDLNKLSDYLAVGESLIVSATLSGSENFSATVGKVTGVAPSLNAQTEMDEIVIWRLHFLRKDPNTIVVFKDKGLVGDATFTLQASLGSRAQFPIISFTGKKALGNSSSTVFNMNITPDTPQTPNPNVYANSLAISSALWSGSVELLTAAQKPLNISLDFDDTSSQFRFLPWIHRTLGTNAQIHVSTPDGTKGDYLYVTDGKQSGRSAVAVAQDAANFIVDKLTNATDVSISAQASPDPGRTFLGHSETRDVQFQARLQPGIIDPSVRILNRWDGWSIDADQVLKIVNDLNTRYGYKLYPDGFLNDTKNIKLYEINVSLSFYAEALKAIEQMTDEQERVLLTKYRAQAQCYPGMDHPEQQKDPLLCNQITSFEVALKDYKNGTDKKNKRAHQIFDLVDSIESFMTFADMIQISGGPNNVYLHSQISGFRMGSENLSVPIYANTYGQQKPLDPDGVVSYVESLLNIDDGEFFSQWLRDYL